MFHFDTVQAEREKKKAFTDKKCDHLRLLHSMCLNALKITFPYFNISVKETKVDEVWRGLLKVTCYTVFMFIN